MDVHPGTTWPLGATPRPDGVNFSIWARDATAVELLFFDRPEDARPSRTLRLEPGRHRTYHYWHAFVPGVVPGQIYGYRAEGPFDPPHGFRFDREKLLLDPYGKALAIPKTYDRQAACRRGDTAGTAMKSIVVDTSRYDWEGDLPLHVPAGRTVIYEAHVRGFTRHESSGVAPEKRGTFAGLMEKIPYLSELGVTAVELMPVFQFDPQDAPPPRTNYWGYSPISFFAPHLGYTACGTSLGALDEFRDLVKALHRAGIEVILDVVYNHTTENDERGPTLCYRGLDNRSYYLLDGKKGWSGYENFSGCGNTLRANHPMVRRLILDSLRYWASEMHVDGFRFDLAAVLSRDHTGHPVASPPVIWDVESDPILCGTKLIAEAWDAGGLYQVGSFVGEEWREWNGRFRDDVRAFMRGDAGTVSAFANRMLASPDLYEKQGDEPERSVNFVTCHDGFTLNDLVTYEKKRNEANGESNRDGTDHDLAWNCGVEGPTQRADVEALRNRQVKNFLSVTLLAPGIPMLLMGDEMRRTQGGNNNAWCQDNETSWVDWRLVERHSDIHRFVRRLIRLRASMLPRRGGPLTLTEFLRRSRIQWHGVRLFEPDWGENSHTLAASAQDVEGTTLGHLLINAWREPLAFELPKVQDGWRLIIDTYLSAPHDVNRWEDAPVLKTDSYRVGPNSLVFLAALAPTP